LEEKIIVFDFLLQKSKDLVADKNMQEFCLLREFEESFSSIANSVDINENFSNEIEDFIKSNEKDSALKPLNYVLFLIHYTIKRKNKIGNLKEYYNKYHDKFTEYKFTRFIELLTDYNTYTDDEHLEKLLKTVKILTTEKTNSEHNFSNHAGVLNFYAEIVCSYYELNLDKREETESKGYLNDASEKIDKAIKLSNSEKVYSKFYLNKGRLKILQGEYAEGEKFINDAIRALPNYANRQYTVRLYEHYLTKLETIRLYDLNTKKIKEVDSKKADNIKSLSVMTALLGFLLGAINIFTNVSSTTIMAYLMLAYMCLIVTLLGVLLVGIALLHSEFKLKSLLFPIALFLVGAAGFASTVIWLIKGC